MRDLLLDAAAAFRLTRLWTKDTLPPVVAVRERLTKAVRERHGDQYADGVDCPWCAGFWISVGVVAARQFAPRWWDVAARALAFSAAAGFLSGDERG